MAEVSKLTDIEVELIEHKKGRSVADIQFAVKHKVQGALDLDEPNLFDMQLVSRMTQLGLTATQAEKFYADNEEGAIRAALDYTEKRMKQSPLDNAPGYFRTALSKGFGAAPAGQAAADKHKALSKPAKVANAARLLTEKLVVAWRSEQRTLARAEFDAKSKADQEADLAAFAGNATLTPLVRKSWLAKGLADPMAAAAFINWLLRDVVEPSEAELLQYGLQNGLLTAAA